MNRVRLQRHHFSSFAKARRFKHFRRTAYQHSHHSTLISPPHIKLHASTNDSQRDRLSQQLTRWVAPCLVDSKQWTPLSMGPDTVCLNSIAKDSMDKIAVLHQRGY